MTEVPMDEVNESVQSEWMDNSTPFERVWAVIKRTYHPQSVSEVTSSSPETASISAVNSGEEPTTRPISFRTHENRISSSSRAT